MQRSRRYLLLTARVALVATLVIAVVALTPYEADADTKSVTRLTRTLRKAKSAKARISAAVALAKLKDRRATHALIAALGDRSSSVQAMAATALGHLGDRRALKALRKKLNDDDDMVSRRAAAAIKRLEGKRPAKRSKPSRLSRVRVDASEAPLRKARPPKLHVTLKSSADKSKGRVKKRTRRRRARRLKKMMLAEISGSGAVTTKRKEATRLGLETFEVDASIVKLRRRTRGKWVEVECEIRLTISNERGKMLSFLTGGAKVQVSRKTYRRKQLRELRKQALENAVRNVNRDLLAFLSKRT